MSAQRQAPRMGRPVKVPGEMPTRERILLAAVELFAERGYERGSMRQIAGAVGITESAVYRHFPSKEALLDAILAHVEGRVTSPLPLGAEEECREGPSIFRVLLEGLAEAFAADPSLPRVTRLLFAEAPHNEKVRRYLKEAYEEKADLLTAAMFERCVAGGLLEACDTRGLARVFNAFRYQWCYEVSILSRDEPLDPERLRRGLEPAIAFFERLSARA